MADSDDIRQMSDPDFLAERARVRDTVEALTERLAEPEHVACQLSSPA